MFLWYTLIVFCKKEDRELSKALIAIDKSKSFRVYTAITTDMVQEAASIHDARHIGGARTRSDGGRSYGHHDEESAGQTDLKL